MQVLMSSLFWLQEANVNAGPISMGKPPHLVTLSLKMSASHIVSVCVSGWLFYFNVTVDHKLCKSYNVDS